MVDPTKRPGNVDPNVPNNRNDNRPVIRNRKTYPWAWIVVIIIVLLIIWAFFGMNHRTQVVNPAVSPAPASSTVR